jgi:hypothetical protein
MALILSAHLASDLTRKRLTVAQTEVTVPERVCRTCGGREFRYSSEHFRSSVAHRPQGTDIFVVTVFWDRGARR